MKILNIIATVVGNITVIVMCIIALSVAAYTVNQHVVCIVH